MGKFLAFYTILLGGKGERSIGSATKTVKWHEERVGEVLTSNFELSVLEVEGILGIPRGVGIFSWLKEKIKCHPYAIHGGTITWINGLLDKIFCLEENWHQDWFNSGRGIVFLVP